MLGVNRAVQLQRRTSDQVCTAARPASYASCDALLTTHRSFTPRRDPVCNAHIAIQIIILDGQSHDVSARPVTA